MDKTVPQPDDGAAASLPSSDGLSARKAALEILEQVLLKKQGFDLAIENARGFHALPPRDRAFVRMLLSTLLRRRGQLDDLIRRALTQSGDPRPEVLKLILYLGITQILFMDIPDHAAVDTSVRLAEARGLSKQKGFINAVLRRMTSEGKEWLKRQDPVQMNIPVWILSQWAEDYGLSTAAEIAQGSLAEAQLDITVKNPSEISLWAGALEATILPTGSLRRTAGGYVGDLPGFAEGAWWVQDASAAIPVRLLGDLSGKHVVDLCAAPGGKTMQLAAAGAKVTAIDRSSTRLKKLQENLVRTRLRGSVEIITSDGAEWLPKEKVDVVLVDAPCTATGTIRRHPDLLALKSERDQESLMDVQARLLENAARMIKPDGLVVYSTCSLQRAEGERQVDAFLMAHPDFARVPITPDSFGVTPPFLSAEGDVRVLPFHLATHGGMDGFYVSVLARG